MKLKTTIFAILVSIFSLNAESPKVMHCQTVEDVVSAYYEQSDRHPEHISFVTGQSSEFLALEICLRAIFQRFHPNTLTDDHLNNLFFLRYPRLDAPYDIQDLFKRFPIVNRGKGVLSNYDSFEQIAKYTRCANFPAENCT